MLWPQRHDWASWCAGLGTHLLAKAFTTPHYQGTDGLFSTNLQPAGLAVFPFWRLIPLPLYCYLALAMKSDNTVAQCIPTENLNEAPKARDFS